MGTSLTGLTPSTTYDALIKVGDNGALSATSKYIGDGLGNDSVLSLSTTKVGIGTSAPTSLLTLSGTSEATPSSTTGGILNVIGSSTNALIIGSLSGSPFGMYIQGGGSGIYPLVLNPQGGDVSIGTTSPTAKLHVKGSGATSATTSLLVQNSGGNAALTITDDLLVDIGSIIQSSNFAIGQSNPNLKGIGQSGSRILINYVNAGGVKFQNSSSGFGTLIVGEVSENMVSFGGITSSFPAIKRASNNIEIKNADDTFGAGLSVGAALNASAILQADSTTKGFLPPRMTTTQKNAMATPAAGLVVYDTTLNKLCVYTTAWETITSL